VFRNEGPRKFLKALFTFYLVVWTFQNQKYDLVWSKMKTEAKEKIPQFQPRKQPIELRISNFGLTLSVPGKEDPGQREANEYREGSGETCACTVGGVCWRSPPPKVLFIGETGWSGKGWETQGGYRLLFSSRIAGYKWLGEGNTLLGALTEIQGEMEEEGQGQPVWGWLLPAWVRDTFHLHEFCLMWTEGCLLCEHQLG
jgi:hypothetical protein